MNTEELKAYLKQAAKMEQTLMTLGHLRDTQKMYLDAYRHLSNPGEYEHPYGNKHDPFSPKLIWCDVDNYPFLQTQPQEAKKSWHAIFNKAGSELKELSTKRRQEKLPSQSWVYPTEPEPVPYAPAFTKSTGMNIVFAALAAGVFTLVLSLLTGSFVLSLIVGIIIFLILMRELNKSSEQLLEKSRKYTAYERAREKYESDLKAYNEREKNYYLARQSIDDEMLEEYTFLMQQRVNEISDSLSENESQLKKVQATLEQLYAMNILHPKYRNFIAVTMLLEYFETERCDTLTGANGAYNLYESELRQNLIIMKLDEVIERLDKLQTTMYSCCAALKTLNQQISLVHRQLSSISVTMNHQLEVQQKTMEFTAATAMYAAATAANTEALKYIALVS